MSRSLRGREVERAFVAKGRLQTSLRNCEECGVILQGWGWRDAAWQGGLEGPNQELGLCPQVKGPLWGFEAGERSVKLWIWAAHVPAAVWRGD